RGDDPDHVKNPRVRIQHHEREKLESMVVYVGAFIPEAPRTTGDSPGLVKCQVPRQMVVQVKQDAAQDGAKQGVARLEYRGNVVHDPGLHVHPMHIYSFGSEGKPGGAAPTERSFSATSLQSGSGGGAAADRSKSEANAR